MRKIPTLADGEMLYMYGAELEPGFSQTHKPICITIDEELPMFVISKADTFVFEISKDDMYTIARSGLHVSDYLRQATGRDHSKGLISDDLLVGFGLGDLQPVYTTVNLAATRVISEIIIANNFKKFKIAVYPDTSSFGPKLRVMCESAKFVDDFLHISTIDLRQKNLSWQFKQLQLFADQLSKMK